MHLRYATVNAPFGRLCFPESSRKPSLGPNTRRLWEKTMTGTGLPLEGVRVVEMTHMVMGPTCGMVLAQLGAEVIKVEPPAGDKTPQPGGHGNLILPAVQPRQAKRRARFRQG